VSKSFFTTGVSALFEMSTADAVRVLPPHLPPIEVRPQRSILNVTAFHFRDTSVGPYAELVFSVVVPPMVSGWSHHPKAGFFPFMAATSSEASQRLLRDELRMPTHPEVVNTRFVEREDAVGIHVWCGRDPVIDMRVTRHEWHTSTHLLHSFMVDGDQRFKADVQISGNYTMHEQEQGSLVLHPHAITRDLTLAEVSTSPFREHWLKEGWELFHPLEVL
jgi:hypothetical protein